MHHFASLAVQLRGVPLLRVGRRFVQVVRVLVSGGEMDLSPGGSGRLAISLAVLALLASLAWFTMEPGRYRVLTFVLLGFFAFRIALARLRSR